MEEYEKDSSWKQILNLLQKQQKPFSIDVNSTEAIESAKKQSFAVIIPPRASSPSIIFASTAPIAPKDISSEAVQPVSNQSQKNDSSSRITARDATKEAEAKAPDQSSKKNYSLSPVTANDAARKSESELQFDREAPSSTPKVDLIYIASGVDYQLIDGLLYHVKDSFPRLCISENFLPEVLKLVHDDNSHAEHHRAYARLGSMYIRKLSRRLTTYIKHCPSCQLNQIKRHKPYEELMPISTSAKPYDTIAIDFVLGLLTQKHGYDAMLTATDKATRKHILIEGKFTWGVSE